MNVDDGYKTLCQNDIANVGQKQNVLELWLRQQFYWLLMTSIDYTFENILCLAKRSFYINDYFC